MEPKSAGEVKRERRIPDLLAPLPEWRKRRRPFLAAPSLDIAKLPGIPLFASFMPSRQRQAAVKALANISGSRVVILQGAGIIGQGDQRRPSRQIRRGFEPVGRPGFTKQ